MAAWVITCFLPIGTKGLYFKEKGQLTRTSGERRSQQREVPEIPRETTQVDQRKQRFASSRERIIVL
jgi:hypothetical protein